MAIRDGNNNSLVMPVDMPTVPIAENTSNNTSATGNTCTAEINSTAAVAKNKFVQKQHLPLQLTHYLAFCQTNYNHKSASY